MESSISNNTVNIIRSEIQALLSILILLFCILITLYIITMPKTVVMEDDGFFIMSAFFNGVSHPPGYPLHTILTHLSTYIPIGNIPSKVHFVSSFFGSLGAVILALIIFHLTQNKFTAFFSALSLGCSRMYWSQSIVAEVYTLNLFIILTLVYIALHIYKTNNESLRIRLIYWSAFLFGLGTSNHWPLVFLTSPALFILYMPHWKLLIRKSLQLIVFFLLGLLPYCWMIYRSFQDPTFNFSGEISSFNDFWYIVSRQLYSELDQSGTQNYTDKLLFLTWFFKQAFSQFIYPISILFLIGFIYQWKKIPKTIAVAFVTSFLSSSVILIMLLGFDFEPLSQAIYRVYFIPAYAFLAIWVSFGLLFCVEWIKSRVTFHPKVIYGIFLSLVLIQASVFLKENNRHNDMFAHDYAKIIFSLIPLNSIVITDDDISVGVLGYYHFVENFRPDLTLINTYGSTFNTRLFHPLHTDEATKRKLLSQFLFQSDKNIFFIHSKTLDAQEINYGLISQYSSEKQSQKITYKFNAKIVEQMLHLFRHYQNTHYFEEYIMSDIMYNSMNWALNSYNSATNQEKETLSQLIQYLSQFPRPLLLLAHAQFGTHNYDKNNKFQKTLTKIEANLDKLSKKEQEQYFLLRKKYDGK